MQLALLFVFCGAGIILSSIIAGVIGNTVLHVEMKDLSAALMKPENIGVSRILQVFTSFFIMGMPALAIGKITLEAPIEYLGFREAGNAKQLGIVVLMVFAGLLLSGAMGELNRIIPIPKNAASFFQGLEDDYNSQVMAMGKMTSTYDYIASLLVLAIIPAIFEEMLFRGCMQQIMVSLTRNAFVGILITSIIFSAIHISYYGFLPRLVLGLMLGYLFYYSKNIWMSIAAHFLNNAFALTSIYMLSRSGKLTPEAMNETYPLYYALIGGGLLYALFVMFKKESSNVLSKRVIVNEENIQQL